MQQRLAEKEKMQKEEHLRELARQAREERQNQGSRRRRSGSYSESDSDSEEEAVRRREDARKERREEFQRELRQSKMGTERKLQMLAREQNRDISEKVALGLAKPTQSGESMYDSRLFNQSSGFDAGFNEDQAYDKPLFAAQDAISSIYRPSIQQDEGEDDGQTYDRITKSSKFEVLGKAKEGFKGADLQEQRDGPVQFEKDADDPFQIDAMIKEVRGEKSGEKRYGIQEPEGRSAKRARVEDDSE
jgi:SNW domain-containing protein 1